MKNKLLAIILVLSLFASALTIAIQVSPVVAAANENVGLYIDPSSVHKYPTDVCTYFNVTVMIENVTDLYGFDFNITWADNTLITFSHCYYNKTLNAIWPGGWFLVKNTTDGGGGGGWYKLVALSTGIGFTKDPGSQALFTLEFHVERGCNFLRETSIHFELVKLSDSNWTKISPLVVTDGLYQMDPTVPGLEFKLIGGENLEYGDEFEVEVNVTDICPYSPIKDYNFTILYNATLLEFIGVDYWGVLGNITHGQANYILLEFGKVQVWDTGDVFWSGDSGLLFALTFHVKFDARTEHIWTTCTPHSLIAQIKFESATLSFEEGTIAMDGIVIPLDITINLIRGDVDCDGDVDVFDLRCVANYYDLVYDKYDLNCDSTIDIFDLVIIATNYGYGTT